ncbi:Unknown protein [Striga hermonthica]|uniref:Uncharacterized protein n=1 Tax=Striga hermonthica TaxID=68872 RepID=A0A9N7RLX1_STRHE|nr:Unknown protein [Striga hermonthica]
MIMREVDEDLAIFLGIRSAVDRNDHPAPVKSVDEFNKSKDLQPKPNCSLPVNATQEHIVPNAAEDSLLDFETEENDCNRQSDSSSLHPVDSNGPDYTLNGSKTPKGDSISMKSEVENFSEESNPPSDSPPYQNQSQMTTNPSFGPNKRPSSSSSFGPHRKPSPRPSTPTSRPTLPTKSRPSRPTLSFPSKPSSRSSTPSRPVSRSSTPNSSRPGPRTSTPTRGKPGPTSTISKAVGPTRPSSASRGRVSRPEEKPNKRQQKSCSPPKMRAQIAAGRQRARVGTNDGDEVNPVLMGTKMVDRVVNMRKLVPPIQDESLSRDNYGSRKPGLENSGFGRSLSKKSLEMAIRHMDIRRSMCEN